MKAKRKKELSVVVAAILVIAATLTGTYAWRSISQTALNEAASGSNPGGRLHDDFDGQNKDIYVENFGDAPIFARIQLREYLETGKDAGINKDDPDRDAVPILTGTDINDTSTWTVHTPDAPHTSFHNEYWKWTMGGETVFMPTFNKNKDSLAADINGTFAGPDGDPETDYDRYDDYVEYTLGEQKTGDAVYDTDADEEDEGDAAIEGVDIETREETHTAKATQNATVLSMAEWKAQGSPTGRYWVYDTDGWAYWAESIAPSEATGLLLEWDWAAKGPYGLVLRYPCNRSVRHDRRPRHQERWQRFLPGWYDGRCASPARRHFRESGGYRDSGKRNRIHLSDWNLAVLRGGWRVWRAGRRPRASPGRYPATSRRTLLSMQTAC